MSVSFGSIREEKKRFIADWVAANGTDEQKAAGVLPMAEAMTQLVFPWRHGQRGRSQKPPRFELADQLPTLTALAAFAIIRCRLLSSE